MSTQESHDDEPVDLEEVTGKGEAPPTHARRFRIRVDKERFVVGPHLTGVEILALVGKAPPRFKLVQHIRGGKPTVIAPTDVVDFRKPGIERFTTMACDQTEGEAPRRDFAFTADDAAYLDSLGLAWEALNDGGARWLLIHGVPTPSGYNQAHVDVALQIVPGYPDAALDMAYFHPPLARSDGKEIKATQTSVTVGGRAFQRWSRHRTIENPWRPGVDSVATQMLLVEDWLAREFAQ